MKIAKLGLPVMSSWVENNERRLDASPFLSGAFEARVILNKLKAKKDPLQELTKGYKGGIFVAPYFKRVYVKDPNYGIPLLGNNDILTTDFDRCSLISKKVFDKYEDGLELKQGWTLITCFGTVGNIAYCRQEMEKCAGSTNFMRVVPNVDKIKSGYLYSFLSSKFGLPLILENETGSVIPNLLPSHIADLPVPRLEKKIETEVHNKIAEAANNRVLASQLLKEASQDIIEYFNLEQPKDIYKYSTPSITATSSFSTLNRIDAYYYAQWNEDAYHAFNDLPAKQVVDLRDVVKDLYIPGIFKRVYTDDPSFGYPYLTGSDVYYLAPTSDRFLSKKIKNIERLILRDGMIIIQDSGQIEGLIGTSVAVGRYLEGFACTNNKVRIVPHSKSDQGYLFAVLNTEYGIRLLKREGSGTSIPHLDEKRIKRIRIPWTDQENRDRLGKKVLQAIELRDQACDLDAEAISLVEQTIEEGANG